MEMANRLLRGEKMIYSFDIHQIRGKKYILLDDIINNGFGYEIETREIVFMDLEMLNKEVKP